VSKEILSCGNIRNSLLAEALFINIPGVLSVIGASEIFAYWQSHGQDLYGHAK